MTTSTGLMYRRGHGPVLRGIDEINRELRQIQARLWPLDLREHPEEIRALLAARELGTDAAERVKTHFLLSREELLSRIDEAGRTPNVPGGGALETRVMPHDYTYPQLYQIASHLDYSRFDRFHRNVSEDGVAVDEVVQVLAGGPMHVLHMDDQGETVWLKLVCPSPSQGWLVTYDGRRPHSGRFADAAIGSKAVVQVIGPPVWTMDYDVPQGTDPPETSG